MRGRTRKWILRSAMRPLVRREILSRRKKGFGIPVVSWLRRMESPDHVRAESLGLDGRWLQQCWHEHRARRADHRGLLWAWYALDACIATKRGGEALPLGVNRRLALSSG
jgi:asparagine synthase (glutamine-hydrolysing)